MATILVVSNRAPLGLILFAAVALTATPASAGGKKQSQQPAAAGTCDLHPGLSDASPVRHAILRDVGTRAFKLPNGKELNLTLEFNTIFNTAVTEQPNLMPTDPPQPGQSEFCDTYLEIRSAVSTLQLNVMEFGIKFGYNPTGDIGTGAGYNGQANVEVGTLAMDFSLWECVNGRCSSIAAATSSNSTVNADAKFTVDFSKVGGEADFVYNTKFGEIVRAVMADGMKKVATSPKLSRLSWRAKVLEYLPEAGLIYFNAGDHEGLKKNQMFQVFAVTPSTGLCNAYRPVADVHTSDVFAGSAAALIDKFEDSARGIKEGDLVLIKPVDNIQ